MSNNKNCLREKCNIDELIVNFGDVVQINCPISFFVVHSKCFIFTRKNKAMVKEASSCYSFYDRLWLHRMCF